MTSKLKKNMKKEESIPLFDDLVDESCKKVEKLEELGQGSVFSEWRLRGK
jgi:hypothetical protein